MPYNTSESAKGFTGVTINNELLKTAQAIIHVWSHLRWETTSIVRKFSGRNSKTESLKYPITTWTYLKEIDQENSSETTLTRYSDYDLDEETGKLDISGGNYKRFFPPTRYEQAGRFILGYNNYEVSYAYGYTTSDKHYPIVQFIEAAIALEIRKNPLLLKSVNLSGGDAANFGDDGIRKLLMQIPRGKSWGVRF